MDTDEAQEVSKQIREKLEKEQEDPEYLNVQAEAKYENIIDTGPTFSTVKQLQTQAGQAGETYEEIAELEDSGIVSFPKLDKERETQRRKAQGKRVPFETGNLLASFDAPVQPASFTFTDPTDFEEVIKEGDEYLSRVEQELGADSRITIMPREGKGYDKIAKWETMKFPLYDIMKYQIVLPFPHEPRVTSLSPMFWVKRTPFTDNPVVQIKVSEWEYKYGTKSYALDVKEGHLFALKGDDWIRIEEKGRVCTNQPLDPNHETPIQKEGNITQVHTLDSRDKVPIAESTRKDARDLGNNQEGDLSGRILESEPRQQVPTRISETPRKRLSFEQISEDEELEKEIKKEKEEVEKIQWELEMERVEIALEKDRLERRKFKLAEDRLRALRKQRKTLEESILKMSEEMAQDTEMPTVDRKQRRITMENEYINQIEFEESAVQEYIPTLFRVEEVLPDVMTTDSQISSTVDPIEFMDEKALMRLKIKHMRADQCRSRTHKMYKLFLESAKDPERKEELEQMLLATIKNIDKKMGKFKSELDSYDQREQFVLARSEQAQAKQERALKEQGDLKKTLEGLQDQQRTTAEELNALQKEKEEADKKQAALKERINEERKAKIQKEQRLEEERQKLKALEKKRREREETNEQTEKFKKMREEKDRDLAKKIEEQERRERERQDKEIAKKLQEKQKREKEEQDRVIAEELERERNEEERMVKKKKQEQLQVEEQMRIEREKQKQEEEQVRLEKEKYKQIEEEMKRKQREELARIEKEHQDLLDKEKKARENRKILKRGVKSTKEEQRSDKEELINTIGEIVNGHKPRKPKDLGWDYQKDKEAKRVFERKKELQKIRKAELEEMSSLCLECRYPKHPGECPCKICGRKGHKEEECPILKPPAAPEPEIDFCLECMKAHPPGKCICKLCKTQGHLETDCPWLREAQANIKPPPGEEEVKEPEVQICLHCRSNTHRMENCAAYKAAQARMKEDWCYGCRQYGHTIVECMDEKQEERNKEIEKEIEKRKKQLEEIDKKMERIKSGVRKDERKVPEDRDTRDYPKETGRKPKTRPRKEREESEPPQPPPREDPPKGPPMGGAGGGGGEPPGDDDPSEPEESEESDSGDDDDEDDEEEEEESDSTEVTEESEFLYDERGRKIDIKQLYKLMRKRKGSSRDEGEIPIKIVRGPRGHRGSKGRPGRKGPPGKPGITQSLGRSVDANVTIDTVGLEKTFRDMGDSMKDVFNSQQQFNRTMKSTLEASAKAQMKQTEALEKLNLSTKQRDHDHMFASIKLYDGKDPKEFDTWVDQIMTACKISGRDPKLVALTKSTGAVTEVILSLKQGVTWVEFVEELRRCFSDSKTRVHAAAIYNDFRRQEDNENLRSYIHKYTKLHWEATEKLPMKSLMFRSNSISFQG